MGRRTSKDFPAFKKAITSGAGIVEAKLAAGYTPAVAKMGRHDLPKRFLKLVEKQRDKFSALAAAHSSEQQEAAVRGALLANLYEGKDRAVQSAKLLGQDKRVNMFTADNQVGIIVIQPPAQLMTELSKRLGSEPPLLQAVTITTDSDTPSDPDPTPL